MKFNYLFLALTTLTIGVLQAADLDGPAGIKFMNERLTLNPYVALSYTYDSNIDSGKHGKSGSQWVVNPGVNIDFKGENWSLDANVWYQYHAYNRYTSQLNESSYGEDLKFSWANAAANEAGWRALFMERFQQIAQDDDMSNHDGRGMGRDRRQVNMMGELERRINEYWHAGLQGNYYFLDYENNVNKYAALYGWKRASVGGVLGYTASKYADLLLSANYMWYWQDNDSDKGAASYGDATKRGRRIASESKGWSVMGGISTHATDKLTYRAMAGWSHFDYGGGVYKGDGWTYQLSGKWQVDAENTLNLMLLGSSYYQPSEREYASARKVSTLSAGVSKSLVRNKLQATVDLAYRKETAEYTEYAADDYDEDIWTVRFGLLYRLNRIFSIYGRVEYQTNESEGGGPRSHEYDYDRWRGTVGIRLTY